MGQPPERPARDTPRLTGWAEWCWYGAAAVSYIVFAIFHKFLLNWFVGPIWLITVIGVGPWVVDRLRRRPGGLA